MCYAIPGKVVEVKGKIALVDYFGEHRKVWNDFLEAKVGDFVYAQGGVIVEKISKKDADLILRAWRKKFFELKKIDSKISRMEKVKLESEVIKIIKKARSGEQPKKSELLKILKIEDKNELNFLFKTANQLRKKFLKNACCVHGIIEFSNYCRNNCCYCGIRRDNKNLKRYRMGIQEIVEAADYAVNKLGFKALVLQSGEDPWYSTKKLVEIIKRIREKCGVLIFMSIGSRSLRCYKEMYKAGARGVLLRFETSNPTLYRKLHSGPKSNFNYRIKLLRYAKRLGYLVATGSLIGLPGQTEADLVNDILLTKSLGAEMWSFGPFLPHPDTPLGKSPVIGRNMVLKVLAVSRLIEPNAKILVTTALETLDKKEGRRMGLLAGANSLMINVTPAKYRKNYVIYPGRVDQGKEIMKYISDTLKLLYSLGRAPTDLGL